MAKLDEQLPGNCADLGIRKGLSEVRKAVKISIARELVDQVESTTVIEGVKERIYDGRVEL